MEELVDLGHVDRGRARPSARRGPLVSRSFHHPEEFSLPMLREVGRRSEDREASRWAPGATVGQTQEIGHRGQSHARGKVASSPLSKLCERW